MRLRSRGFTLLEIMIVIAIIGIVAAMAAWSAQSIGARNVVQNAGSEIGAAIQAARARAESRGTDVYVVVYPTFRKQGFTLTGGNGAVAIFEDANGDFMTATGACTGGATTGDCGWANYAPPNIHPAPATADRNLGVFYLDDYIQKGVKFGEDPGMPDFPLPFSTITAASMTTGCHFCGGNRGAIVFTSDSQVVFLNNSGTPTAGRVGAISLTGTKAQGATIRFGMVASTGLVTVVK
jgi:prepilin-type N-terminal cleavage/methylation domain-containing protein